MAPLLQDIFFQNRWWNNEHSIKYMYLQQKQQVCVVVHHVCVCVCSKTSVKTELRVASSYARFKCGPRENGHTHTRERKHFQRFQEQNVSQGPTQNAIEENSFIVCVCVCRFSLMWIVCACVSVGVVPMRCVCISLMSTYKIKNIAHATFYSTRTRIVPTPPPPLNSRNTNITPVNKEHFLVGVDGCRRCTALGYQWVAAAVATTTAAEVTCRTRTASVAVLAFFFISTSTKNIHISI